MVSQINIEKALSTPGWMSPRELIWLATQAQKCHRIVEFGSYLGRSTRALADNCPGKVWAVDPWNGDYFTESGDVLDVVNTYVMPEFLYNLEDHIKSGKVIPIRDYSTNFKYNYLADMVFIDGDHRYHTVIKDIKKALSILKSGGIISGHDYEFPTWPGVKQAVDEMLSGIQVEDTIWWTQKY